MATQEMVHLPDLATTTDAQELLMQQLGLDPSLFRKGDEGWTLATITGYVYTNDEALPRVPVVDYLPIDEAAEVWEAWRLQNQEALDPEERDDVPGVIATDLGSFSVPWAVHFASELIDEELGDDA